MEHLELPVLDSEEAKVVGREVLEVERLPDGAFKLLHSPAFVWGIAAGDVIELAPDELSGMRLRYRAGNVAIVLALSDDADKSGTIALKLIDTVVSLGGACEGGPKRTLVFSVPVRVGFNRIESALDDAKRSLTGADWWYGNVLDKHDRPLGWWKEGAG